MVYINIINNGIYVILDCYKGSWNGEHFRLVINRDTQEIVEKPEYPDIDASAAYSHVYAMLRNKEPLPAKTVAAWG